MAARAPFALAARQMTRSAGLKTSDANPVVFVFEPQIAAARQDAVAVAFAA